MLNTTKLLIAMLILIAVAVIVMGVWVITPQHSGVAMSTLLVLTIVGGLVMGLLFDTPRMY